jgi:D-glycero-D-manno-heptose 1,7-bisphosphate phosphatase
VVKVALIDRDGVINRDSDAYIKSPAELEVFPFAREAVATFRRAGWLVYIVSNQSAVARGLTTAAALDEITARLEKEAGPFDGVFYCYHHPDDGCDCRKPNTGLIKRALADAERRSGERVEVCWMVGDTFRTDMVAGMRGGCRTALVLTGSATAEEAAWLDPPPDLVADDLLAAARVITAAAG